MKGRFGCTVARTCDCFCRACTRHPEDHCRSHGAGCHDGCT